MVDKNADNIDLYALTNEEFLQVDVKYIYCKKLRAEVCRLVLTSGAEGVDPRRITRSRLTQ